MKAPVGTISGKLVDVLDPDPDTIDIRDIAISLAREGRYSNFTQHKYSVSQHVLLVSRCLPPPLQLQGLLHDSEETYMRDLPSNVKKALPDYKRIALNLRGVILQKFGCDPVLDPLVDEMDKEVFRLEIRDLYTPEFRQRFWPDEPETRLDYPTLDVTSEWSSRELFMMQYNAIHEMGHGCFKTIKLKESLPC